MASGDTHRPARLFFQRGARCRYGADLIVVGSHGQSLWREGVLGCFTCAVLHHAQYPVFLLNVQIKKARAAGLVPLSTPPRCSAMCSSPRTFRKSSHGPWIMWSVWRLKELDRVTLLNALDVPGT